MDFARRQLEKYGWSDGKGLGKNENGISQAIKPKLKHSVTGIGHDAAEEFTEHWWSALYDKAVGNVQVKEKNGKIKKIQTKNCDEFEITSCTWKIKKKIQKGNNEQQYADYFVKKAVLSNGGSKTENVGESDMEDEKERKDVFKMTDEELFAACEGRTAHKGARHGLKALGKLARIEQQEQELLNQMRFKGYSHFKKKTHLEEIVEDLSLNSATNVSEPKIKKKKKKKHCVDNETKCYKEKNKEMDMTEQSEPLSKKNKKRKISPHDICETDIEKDNQMKVKIQFENNNTYKDLQKGLSKPKKQKKNNCETKDVEESTGRKK